VADSAQELAIMTKVHCSEAAVNAMAFPLYDGGNVGVCRCQLHEMLSRPGYDAMLAARGAVPPWEEPDSASLS
jgi:hypothetical protein